MIMLKSTHDMEMMQMQVKYQILLSQWNSLVDKINARGGEAFLYGSEQKQFSDDEIKTLINLCHPDKHQQKKVAVEMTQKLLAMRN